MLLVCDDAPLVDVDEGELATLAAADPGEHRSEGWRDLGSHPPNARHLQGARHFVESRLEHRAENLAKPRA
jgi:hypothetical protein